MRKILYILLIVISYNVWGQDTQFSQFYSSPMYLSPSFAGTTNGIRAIGIYRSQWYTAFDWGYNSTMVSVDHNFKIYNSGLGLILISDFAGKGALNREKVALDYNYNVAITRGLYFRPGVEFSYTYIGISDNFTFGSEMLEDNPTNDALIENSLKNYSGYFDANAAIFLYSQKYWGGVTLSHLMRPNESLTGTSDKLPIKTVVFVGGKYDLNGRLGRDDEESITASAIYRSQGEYDQFDIGASWLRKSVQLGFWYRGLPGFKKNEDNSVNHDALVLFAKYKTKKWGVGYSYDITISGLYADTGGAHEISLYYIFLEDKELKRRQKRIKVPCPRF